MKKLLFIAAIATVSGCSHIQPIPENWESTSILSQCEYMGRAKASGQEILAQRIFDNVDSMITERDVKMCMAHYRQGAVNYSKEARADAGRKAAVDNYNNKMFIINTRNGMYDY